ncbi:hypothetical protein F503_03604 [Ophiostoma piceae UAMH 11346]|uniref:Phospholipid-binding protein n=1 Tax=Ophiostoma piceae (strain UAMH 11346) TaxID=1262450 RepID=S3BVG1_OPHP1|nr:hypothetical protein F503_03604 [Ophiostoma piceae UAMH 11346]
MVPSPTSPFSSAGLSSSSSRHHDSDVPPPSAVSPTYPYSSGYSSFPSAAQSPPTTASTMRPSLTGLLPGSSVTTGSAAPSITSAGGGTGGAPRPSVISFSHDDTDKSRLAYDTLAATAKAYRVALSQLSLAASNFGAALESCARLKEARAQPYPPGPYATGGSSSHSLMMDGGSGFLGGDVGGNGGSSLYEASCTADVLLATSGLYYLMANQQGILAETVYRSFELPIVHEMDRYAADVEAEQESYASGMREASREIRRLEKEGVKLRKPRQRDVGRMRSHLVAMTDALDGLTARQAEHAVALLDQSRDMSGTVSQASRNLVRAEVDILDALARKGWPGGGLDVVLDGAVDLFSRDGDDYDDDTYENGGGVPSILGGMTNGSGINSSLHAVVSGAGGILGSGLDSLHLGPKPLLSGSSDDDEDDDERTARIAVQDEDGDADDDYTVNENDDDQSEVSTINGNSRSRTYDDAREEAVASTSGSGSGVFSILKSGSILNQSVNRGRTPRKEPHRSTSRKHASRGIDGDEIEGQDAEEYQDHENDDVAASSRKTPRHQTRSARADSLSVDVDDTTPTATPAAYHQEHQYQSLDSLASDAASLSISSSRHNPGVPPHISEKSASRGRSRPFSPQRVSVDPSDDLFTARGAKESNSLAWLKEDEQLESSQPLDNDEAEDSDAGAKMDKGKGAAPPESVSSRPASRASSSTVSARGTQPDTDEGVQVWR